MLKKISLGLLAVCFPVFSGAVPFESNLVVHWGFDEGSGNFVNDSVGENESGYFVGTPTWQYDAQRGNSVYLDGSDDGINFSNPQGLDFLKNASFTLSGWVKADGGGTILNWGDNMSSSANQFIMLWVDSEGKLTAGFRGANEAANTTYLSAWENVVMGEWFQYTITRDFSENISLYVDGVMAATAGDESGAINFSPQRELAMGIHNFGYGNVGNLFTGSLSDTYIWNVAFEASDVQELTMVSSPSIMSLLLLGGLLGLGARKQSLDYS